MGLEDDISNIRADVAEIKSLMDHCHRPRVQDFLLIETRRLETKLIELVDKLDEENKATEAGKVRAAQQSQSEKKAYDFQLKTYSWDQSDKFVKVYLTNLKNVQSLSKEDFEFSAESASVHFVAKNLDGRNCIFDIKELAYKINPEKSEYKVKSETLISFEVLATGREILKIDFPPGRILKLEKQGRFFDKTFDMVVLMLKKYETEKWSHLKMSDKRSTDKPRFKPPTPDAGKDADPSASLMTMMKQMYEDGDDDMKRTIAKAWTESRGASSELP